MHGDNALHQHRIFLRQRQSETLPQTERIQRFARDAREVNALQLHRRGRLTVPLQVALRHALQRIRVHDLVAGERPRCNAPRFRVCRVDVFAPQQRGQRYAVKPLPAAIGEHARAEPARVAGDAHGADVARQPPFARNFLRQLAQMQLPRQLRLVERPAEVRRQHVQQARQRGVNRLRLPNRGNHQPLVCLDVAHPPADARLVAQDALEDGLHVFRVRQRGQHVVRQRCHPVLQLHHAPQARLFADAGNAVNFVIPEAVTKAHKVPHTDGRILRRQHHFRHRQRLKRTVNRQANRVQIRTRLHFVVQQTRQIHQQYLPLHRPETNAAEPASTRISFSTPGRSSKSSALSGVR